MASEPEVSDISSLFERLVGNRDLSLFMPFLFGFTNIRSRDPQDPGQESENRSDPDRENENRTTPRERIFLVNPFTQSMVVIEGTSSLESLLRDFGGKDGQPPASKASIEALPSVEITEEGECVICLDNWEVGAVAKELPCKHKFHTNCIEKWLGIHGSCPVCRHQMPVDDQDMKKGDTEGRGRREREIWVGFSFSSDRRSDDSNRIPSSDSHVSSSSSTPDHEVED